MATNTIHIGNSTAAPFLAFGDESIAADGDMVVYAYVIVRRTRLHQVEGRLRRLKRQFKIPQEVMLHCRQLMAPHQREKLGIAHLSTEDARLIIARAITLMNESYVWVKYAYCSLASFTANMGDVIQFTDNSGAVGPIAKVNPSAKALTGMLAHAAMVAFAANNPGPRAEFCEVFASEERTAVKPLFGDGPSKQADSIFGGFSDIGTPPGSTFRLDPQIAPAERHECFQLADIAAYLCANAKSKRQKYPFYEEQLSRLRFWTRSDFCPVGPDGMPLEHPAEGATPCP
ncbi:hypothetical protein ACTOWA_09465 [Herbaspirillum seropedicae]|uniref:hypothetical protein n=1 Tax=Herbaspirillum seropedicae TaxID=964 RepID=UPI003F8D3F39